MRGTYRRNVVGFLVLTLVVSVLPTTSSFAKAKKPTTITCVKGQIQKRITAVAPKCPKGYKTRAQVAADKAAAEKVAAQKVAAERAAADKAAFVSSVTASRPVDYCRLRYPNQWETGFGFPRTATRLPTQGVIRAIFIFVDFPDAPGSDDPKAVARTYFDSFNEYYKAISYGKVSFTYQVPDRYFRINKPSSSYRMNMIKGETDPDPGTYFRDALDASDPFVDFSPYDVVYVIPSETTKEITYGPSFPMGAGNDLLRTNEKVFYSGAVGGTDSRQRLNSEEWVWLAHETGHLFGLEHPYLVQSTPQGATTVGQTVAIWDLMLNMWLGAPKAREFLGWTRFLIGWLDDNQVSCHDISDVAVGKDLKLLITPLGLRSSDKKLALIRVSDTTAFAIEVRRRTAFDDIDKAFEGVLIYKVDVSKGSNQGLATVITSNPLIVRDMTVGTMKVGSTVTYENYVFEIQYSDELGEYVVISLKK